MIAYSFQIWCNNCTKRFAFDVVAPDFARMQALAVTAEPLIVSDGWIIAGPNTHFCPDCIITAPEVVAAAKAKAKAVEPKADPAFVQMLAHIYGGGQ